MAICRPVNDCVHSIVLITPTTTSAITPGAAQTNKAAISGRITDEQGNAVSKAKVVATNLDLHHDQIEALKLAGL
jgi:hypothetical protein